MAHISGTVEIKTNVFDCDDGSVAVTPVKNGCSPQWNVTTNVWSHDYFAAHRIARTLQQCQDACLLNPECVALAYAYQPHCYMYRKKITTFRKDDRFSTYTLMKRCDITPGLYFIDTSRDK